MADRVVDDPVVDSDNHTYETEEALHRLLFGSDHPDPEGLADPVAA